MEILSAMLDDTDLTTRFSALHSARPKRVRTRERILDAALCLLNLLGERHVSTKAILVALDMSPGCFYYHFSNKSEIVKALLVRCENEILQQVAAQSSTTVRAALESCLGSLLRTTWRYRFLYRDLNDLLSRFSDLTDRYRSMHDSILQLLQRRCQSVDSTLHRYQTDALSTNMMLVLTYWLSFECAFDPRAVETEAWETRMVDTGLRHLMFLADSLIDTRPSA